MSLCRIAHEAGHALVLIVEDEEPIALALSFIVEDAGYEPLIAGHGKEAIELMRTHQVALIITDLMMPVMSGQEFIANLHSGAHAEGKQRPPLIIMTAAGSGYVGNIDADAILLKPFEVAKVEELLRRFLA
jgi:CheY-like chemotaxis protein